MELLSILGMIIALIGGVWLIVTAFREGLLWGLGCLLLPIVSLAFVIMHWDEAKKPFLVNLLGVLLVFLPKLVE